MSVSNYTGFPMPFTKPLDNLTYCRDSIDKTVGY